ncbi:MAG: hypothetical protein A2297_02220 [Elusimicrobia bacterium RIFOXYB2_FULL_48_7]|nr:MAG: hypothetical protein A2297_02220 [Elusimicrobia bacterium RIFOXYB2_FULL_48_7]
MIITKGINLIGAGVNKTVIIDGYPCAHTWNDSFFIIYQPSDFSGNYTFRISSFTFNLNNNCSGIVLDGTGSNVIQTKIRIDHNSFINAYDQALENQGMRGVVDNNTFNNIGYPLRSSYGDPQSWWDNWGGVEFGAADNNMYFEDNTLTGIADHVVCDCQEGNRYVFRYNTITTTKSWQGLFDMHGNQPGGFYGCFGGEIYGNQINGAATIRLLDHRGGKALVFNNNANTSYLELQVREEFDDSLDPTTNPQPQHISDSYYWNNRKNLTGDWNGVTEGGHVGDIPLRNRDFYVYLPTETFNGTSGMGAGLLADRPATCTPGTAYWATTQNCSDLTGMVGVKPSTPIAGTLYKCTSTNTWTPYYIPYPYPHPLRWDSSDTTAPSAPGIVNDGTGADTSTTISITQLSANWDSSADAESGISSYQYAITSNTAISNKIVGWTTIGLNTSVTRTGLALTVGVTYYFSVKAVNGAGLTSAAANSNGALVIDVTPPVMGPGGVRDGTGADIQWSQTSNSLSGNWDTAVDAESGISGYRYAIGVTPGGTGILGWISVGNYVLEVTTNSLTLIVGTTYYFSVKAINGVGLITSAVNSNGQYVVSIDTNDTTPPTTPAQVRDGLNTVSETGINYTTITIQANWDASVDAESGIAKYWWAVGTTPGSSNIKNWTNIGQLTLVDYTGFSLTPGVTYYVSVKAENGAGLQSSTATSSGQVVSYFIDTTPPAAPVQVRDGTGADIQWAMTNNSLTGNWDTAVDAESGISGYKYAIGEAPGATDVSGWIFVGSNVLAITKTGLTLSPGSTYYFSVKAINGAGLTSSAANSNGHYVITIDTNDTTPPATPAQIRDGLNTISQTSINYTTTTITANWDASADAESGIARYWYTICTIPTGNDVKGWTDNGQLTLVYYSGLSLTPGVTYYVRVKAENGAGLQSAIATSIGQVVMPDTTGPVISGVSAQNITTTSVKIFWTTDEPSTSQVEYGRTINYGKFTIEDPLGALKSTHDILLTDLITGSVYYFRVISRDAAGNETTSANYTFTALAPIIPINQGIHAYPNPYNLSRPGGMKFRIAGMTSGEVSIYTISGRLIKKLTGSTEISWDGTNKDNEKVPRGIYIYTITQANGDKITGKIAVTR